MKKILLYATVFAALLVSSSCSDSFITNQPSTDLPGNKEYTEAMIDQSMIGSYLPLQWFDLWMPLPLIAEAMGDDIRVGGGSAEDQLATHDISRYRGSASTHSDAIWSACYEGIFHTNIVINRAAEVKMDKDKIDRLIAEAYALRTFYYYQVWRFYGNIPFFENNPTDIVSEWKNIKQYKADEMYEFLIRDINKALEGDHLPLRTDAKEYGRFSRAAAQMLKAHIVLTQADQSKYAEVVTDMKTIIESPLYDLEPNFASMWESAGEWGKESIFEINYTDNGATRGWGDDGKKPGGSVFPTMIGINGFNDNSGIPSVYSAGWGFMPMEKHLYDLYEDADQRKNGGILSFDYYVDNINPKATYDDSRWDNTGYFNKKYLPRKGENSLALGSTDLNYRNNHRIYRLADTYLIAAELILRTGGDQGTAETYLNKVRGRAYQYTGTYQKSATLDNILAERRLEFSGEGHRFFDLLRFGKATDISKEMQTGWKELEGGKRERIYGTFKYTSDKRYFPIPKSEIDRSLGALTQNEGY